MLGKRSTTEPLKTLHLKTGMKLLPTAQEKELFTQGTSRQVHPNCW
jgi:hypothetical protein